jgi:signal transduction histidine kinase
MLTWERMLFLLSVLTITSLGAVVLIRGRRDLIRVTFSVFLFSVAALALNVYSIRLAMGRSLIEELDILGRLSFGLGGVNCGALWAFTEVFPRPRQKHLLKRRLILSYSVGLAASLIALSPWFWRGVRVVGQDIQPRLGFGAVLWSALLLFALAAAVINLVKNYRSLPKGHLRNQVRYTFLGFSVLAFPAAVFSILLPSLGNVNYVSLVPFFGTLTALIITYAVVRHRLMDLGVIFRNTLVHVSVILSVAALVGGFHILLTSALDFPSTLSMLLAAGVVASGFETLKERISALVDTHLFRGRYDYQKVVVDFGETVSRMLDLRELEKCVVDKTVETMRAENGLILVADARFEDYRTEYALFPGTRLILDRVLFPGNVLLEEVKHGKKAIVEQEVRRTRTEKDAASLLQEMARLRSAIVIPLVSKDRLLGILSLGEKKSGDNYSAEDVSLLMVLANQAAPSLENSRLFNKILVVKNHQDNILQNLRSGVITVDQENRIKSVNRSAIEILNTKTGDLLQRDVSVLGSQLSKLVIERLQEGYGHFEGEVVVDVKGRGSVPLGVVATTMAGERDSNQALLVFDDLSEVKLLHERIRRADRLAVVGTFAAGMAHEIKNPLVPIKTFSQLLPEMFDDEEFRSRYSALVLKEVDRINHIIEKLLDFARPMKPVPGPCDMHELINEVVLLLEENVSQKRIKLKKGFTKEPAVITADKHQIKQVLLNLLLNALQAVGSDGRIEVSTLFVLEPGKNGNGRRPRNGRGVGADLEGENGKVRKFEIKVSDTGCGIAEKDLKHLFDPFFTTKPEGTGLGLAISHVIVREHNGTLDAESELGKGTTFTLKLPAVNNL